MPPLVLRILRPVRVRIRNAPGAVVLYAAGFATSWLGFVAIVLPIPLLWQRIALVAVQWLASVIVVVGLATDIRSLWARRWGQRVATWAVKAAAVLQAAIVAVLSLAMARQIANEITGVPPDKLSASVTIAAALITPAVWIAGALLFAIVMYALLAVYMGAVTILHVTGLRDVALGVRNSSVYRFLSGQPAARWRDPSFCLLAGRMFAIGLLMIASYWSLERLRDNRATLASWYTQLIVSVDYFTRTDCTAPAGARVVYLDNDRIGLALRRDDGSYEFRTAACERPSTPAAQRGAEADKARQPSS